MKGLPIIIISFFLSISVFGQDVQLSSSETVDNHFEISKNLDIYVSLFKELNTYYVDEIDASELIKTSIKAMLNSLDPYTVYYPESDAEDFRFMTTGNYGGIGAIVGNDGKNVTVTEPYQNFPADKSGLKAGDIILEIDDKDASGMSTDDVTTLLRGQPGTKVKLKIRRPFLEKEMDIELTREKIHIDNVPYYGMLTEKIGYVQLTGFRQNSGNDVKKAILELEKNNDLKGLVFDLRGNPGGLLIEAVKISGLFVDRGELIVSTKGKVESWNKEYKTYEQPVAKDLPLVVLINGGSASASEIVSGSLQDLDRAVLIGSRSLGKGLVQTTRKLSYNTQMKVTTSKYYIPSGRCIQEIDYSKRDKNGKAVKVADSLVNKFETRNGRTVYDGKGISPDVKIGEEDYPEIIKSLVINKVIFDYATKYYHSNDTIEKADDFELTEDEYNDFVNFCKSRDLKYKTSTEKSLEKLKKNAEEEKYFDLIASDYDDMLKKVEASKKEELITHKADIKKLLENEIVGRYYYYQGEIKYALKHDEEIDKAVELLNDPEAYNKILKP